MDNADRIEQYLDGGLDEAARVEFEQRLIDDASLREELAFHKQVRAAVVLEEREAIRQMLPVPASSNRGLWITAVAGVLLLAVIGVVFRGGVLTSEELFAEYYRTYPNVVAPSVRGAAPDDDAGRAFLAYDNGDFVRAEGYFSGIAEGNPALMFYHAMTLMELQRFSEAVDLLQQLQRVDEPVFEDSDLRIAVPFYLALGKLMLDDRAGAARELQRIAGEQHIHGMQARSLLEKL